MAGAYSAEQPAEAHEPLEEFASPLSLLLSEERLGGRRVHEALFLSFTADLGFFESVALGVTQALGARITVVGDVNMATVDPRAVRRAGRGYLPGLALGQGAFHPKLVALTGFGTATIAIGSGNVTLAGWQANSELWTVLRADADLHPACLPQLAAWLRGLPSAVRLSGGVPEACARVAAQLDELSAAGSAAADEVVLVSSLNNPILKQLPQGPVDELSVFAPFHDPSSSALRELVRRFNPERLTVAYQPGLTELDGRSLANLLRERNGRLVVDPTTHYRHGKLIEWVVGGRRWALTGSANLSGAALLRSQQHGGNCELGLIAPIGSSLLPIGLAEELATVQTAVTRTRSSEPTGPLLLGATRAGEGLQLILGRKLAIGGHLELSAAAAPPEAWERVADVPADCLELTVTVAADAGSRLRLVTIGEDGVPSFGNVVFIVEPAAVLLRRGLSTPKMPTTQPVDLFTDAGLAERFFTDLQILRTNTASVPKAFGSKQSTAAAEIGATAALDGSADGWEAYLDRCAGRLGTSLLRFALGLVMPVAVHVPHQDLLRVSWDEEMVDEDPGGLEDDTAEAVLNAPADDVAADQVPDLTAEASEVRRRYRRWIERLVALSGQLEAPERMLVVRLTIWTVAANAWPTGDLSWMPLLADALTSLADHEPPGPIEAQVGSLAAVGLAVLRASTPRFSVADATMSFNRARRAAEHLLPAAEQAYVQEYSRSLERALGPAIGAAAVLDLAEAVVQNDDVAEAELALTERGRAVRRHGPQLLHVTGDFGNPALVAIEAVGVAEDQALIGAWASTSARKWAMALWRRPDLFVIESTDAGQRWRHFALRGLVGPRALAAAHGFGDLRPVPHGAQNRPIPAAMDVLIALGLTDPTPPASP